MYKKPIVIKMDDMAEAVYTASGTADSTTGGTDVSKCDSKYMKGTWQSAHYRSDGSAGYQYQYGCIGCKGYSENGCNLDNGNYDVNYAGNYMPAWEKRGYGPYDQVTDWNCG
jgi:hypothetical protein